MSGAGGASTGGASGAGGASTGGTAPDASAGGAGGGGRDAGSAGKDGGGNDGGLTEGGDAGLYTQAMIDRGAYLVRSVALCGGCHTAAGGAELAGNPKFKGGKLPAPNLTSDATGLGSWTDQQIMNAFRNGVDDEGRNLDKAMPYWMFHNMTDSDAMAIVAFLRSLPHISNKVNDAAVGESNPDAAAVLPLSPADFPDTSLPTTDGNYAAAQTGKYLLSSVAGCVRCHSPSNAGLPAQQFFSGVAPTSGTQIFSSNITPDATGIAGWTAAEVAAALKVGTRGDGAVLCGSMPSGSKGYGGLTDADATAIGIYLTTIPGVANAAAEPSLEPACP